MTLNGHDNGMRRVNKVGQSRAKPGKATQTKPAKQSHVKLWENGPHVRQQHPHPHDGARGRRP
ncbi:MAG: hypothetical protein ACSLE2_06460, partial [Lysobacterales bacterium]